MRRLTRLLCLLPLTLLQPAQAELVLRQHVHVVGSSTAYPIIAAAAEHFGRTSDWTTPVVESTGTGGGIKLFCAGLDLGTPDIAMASRSMKASERRDCEGNHVTDIREVKIGFDGIVIANRKAAPVFSLSRQDIYLALARQVPSRSQPGTVVDNPYRTWQEVNPDLPDIPIRVYGPPPTSGTRDILLERVLSNACLAEPTMRELFHQDHPAFLKQCHALREDGAFVNAGENDARIVRKLGNDPEALGILGFNFLDRNRDRLQAASIDGVLPEFESIESGDYPLSRPLYLYAKPQHYRVVGGLQSFLEALVSPEFLGEEGRLVEQGLIPLPAAR